MQEKNKEKRATSKESNIISKKNLFSKSTVLL